MGSITKSVESKTSFFNKYTLVARAFPAILCAIPFIVLQYFFLDEEVLNFLEYLGNLKLVGDITITLIVLYGFSQGNRILGKVFQNKYFQDELKMPTTNFLLFSNNHYSKKYKSKIHNKIRKDFGFTLANEKTEKKNEKEARKRIAESMSMIRKKVGEGTLLFQHNIEYGFIRNLIGGSIPALILSVLNIYLAIINSNQQILYFSIFLAILFLLLLLFSKKLIQLMGISYAKILIQEYMAL